MPFFICPYFAFSDDCYTARIGFKGQGLVTSSKTAVSEQQCKKLCEEEACLSFDYDTLNQTCHFYNSSTTATPDSCCSYWTKEECLGQ